jgi:hypothetical protein
VCGGYYSAFKDLFKTGKHLNVGFPIAKIDSTGETILTKEKDTGSITDIGSVTSQLLYEIQGPLYYNSDVVAQLEGMRIEQFGRTESRVRMSRPSTSAHDQDWVIMQLALDCARLTTI